MAPARKTTDPLPESVTTEAVHLPAASKWFTYADQVVQNYNAIIPKDHGKDVITSPEYWTHHVNRVSPLSMIFCIDEQRRWEVWLRVVEKGQNFLRVAVVNDVDYKVRVRGDEVVARLKRGYLIEEMGQAGYRIIDPQKKELIAGLLSKEEADQYLEVHLEDLKKAA